MLYLPAGKQPARIYYLQFHKHDNKFLLLGIKSKP